MRSDLRILGPVILILLAGFLASYPSFDGDFSSLTGAFISSPLTGASVVAAGTCAPERVIFKISALDNAHAELHDESNYGYEVCWDSLPLDTDRTCHIRNGIIALSDVTNAHVEHPDNGLYNELVCYGKLECEQFDGVPCPSGSACIAKLSANTNAHVGDCNSAYPISLCCGDGFPPGGGQARADTDQDRVWDDGDGKGIGNNPCNPSRFSNFNTCDDNCIDTPNGPALGTCFGGSNKGNTCTSDTECPSSVCHLNQEDTDGDGAGDVCDAFYDDSCSIVTKGDNCANYGACAASLVANWKQSSVKEGEDATLEVVGDTTCDGLTFAFSVIESSGTGVVETDPQPAVFGSGKVTSTWQGEYHATGNNKYSFQAVSQQGIQVSSPQSALLTVTQDPATGTGAGSPSSPGTPGAKCGDNKVQRSQGEECDAGSNNCQYTQTEVEASGSSKKCGSAEYCYADCQLIPGGGGSGCKTASQCKGKPAGLFAVCNNAQPSQIQYCIKGPGGCLQLSNAQTCGKTGGVQNVCIPNLPSCQSPTCTYNTQPGSCVNDQRTITCSESGGAHCTSGCTGYPKIQACYEEPQEDFPFFNGWNVLLSVVLLSMFYVVRRKL